MHIYGVHFVSAILSFSKVMCLYIWNDREMGWHRGGDCDRALEWWRDRALRDRSWQTQRSKEVNGVKRPQSHLLKIKESRWERAGKRVRLVLFNKWECNVQPCMCRGSRAPACVRVPAVSVRVCTWISARALLSACVQVCLCTVLCRCTGAYVCREQSIMGK